MSIGHAHTKFSRSSGAQCLQIKVDTKMNLIKQEENTEESPTSQLVSQLFGPVVGFAIGDPTGISGAAVSVITK